MAGLWVILISAVIILLLASIYGIIKHQVILPIKASRQQQQQQQQQQALPPGEASKAPRPVVPAWYEGLSRRMFPHMPPSVVREELERMEVDRVLVPDMVRKQALDREFAVVESAVVESAAVGVLRCPSQEGRVEVVLNEEEEDAKAGIGKL